jgi:hypothetical protein
MPDRAGRRSIIAQTRAADFLHHPQGLYSISYRFLIAQAKPRHVDWNQPVTIDLHAVGGARFSESQMHAVVTRKRRPKLRQSVRHRLRPAVAVKRVAIVPDAPRPPLPIEQRTVVA